jgi:hypothetical protein
MSFVRFLRRMAVASGVITYTIPYSAAARVFSRNSKYSVPYALQYTIADSLMSTRVVVLSLISKISCVYFLLQPPVNLYGGILFSYEHFHVPRAKTDSKACELSAHTSSYRS